MVSEREGRAVVSVRTTEEIAAVAGYANGNELAIEIAGAGSKRGWGNAVAADLLLDMTRMNRVVEHAWQDLTCTVQAGCTWAALQQTLARHRQFVALDPLFPTRATVGGIVATNDSGALRHRYGSLRDLIIGMTIVLADGTVARSGGKVVKNVAGYDLHKMMTGAFGTLGVIAEVTFRLHPLPLHAQSFTVSAAQAVLLAPLMAAIRDSHLLTQALQLRGDRDGFHLDVQLNAHPDARQGALLAAMVGDHSASGEVRPCSAGGLHMARQLLFRRGATMIKLSVQAADLGVYLDRMRAADEVEVNCVAQSSGLIYASLQGAEDAMERYLQTIEVDYAILATARTLERWKASPNALSLMREIKQQFDPNRIFNPGRFVGGI
jgi:glycolate oxidase FAD binding subunit